MKTIRAFFRILLLVFATLFFYLLAVMGNLISFAIGKRYWLRTYFLHQWGKYMAWITGMRISVKGSAPKPPFFLVSNHLGYTDVWVLYSQLRCTFVAKNELRRWPIVGFFLKTVGLIFIDRTKRGDVARVNQAISANMNAYQGVVLFPEGTTSAGAEILPFTSSLFEFPSKEGISVSCAAITYKTPDNEKQAYQSVCWWGNDPFLPHLFSLLKMKRFYATITFSEKCISDSDRKEMAKAAREVIVNNFNPVIKPNEYAEKYISH